MVVETGHTENLVEAEVVAEVEMPVAVEVEIAVGVEEEEERVEEEVVGLLVDLEPVVFLAAEDACHRYHLQRS